MAHTILDTWDITPEFLTECVHDNPSLRGMLLGYIAEKKLWEVFDGDKRITELRKDDDHDRKKKGDLVVTYKGSEYKIEVKSLQTNSIKIFDPGGEVDERAERWIKKIVKLTEGYLSNPDFEDFWEDRRKDATYKGTIQCDASDRRTVRLSDGSQMQTTCLRIGEFDILAAGLFGFRESWDFAYALNRDLPRTKYSKYSELARKELLASSIPISWPVKQPFVLDPYSLLETLHQERQR